MINNMSWMAQILEVMVMSTSKNNPWVGLFVVSPPHAFAGVGEVVMITGEELPVGPMLHVRKLRSSGVVEVLPYDVRILVANPHEKVRILRMVIPHNQVMQRGNIAWVKGVHMDPETEEVVSADIEFLESKERRERVPIGDLLAVVAM
jgi:hypothetical protein